MKTTHIVGGYSATHQDERGSIDAQIYRPERHRAWWALAFARCTGEFAHLTGKYQRHDTMAAAVAELDAVTAGTEIAL